MLELVEDFETIKKQLHAVGLEKNVRRINRRILRRLGSKSRTKARQSFRANFGKGQTGELYKSIKHRLTKGNSVIISPTGGKNMMKANVLETGATIRPKQGNFLTYQINGKWVKSRVVHIQGRNWFHSSIERFMKSTESRKMIEETLYKEVDKIWKKAGK